MDHSFCATCGDAIIFASIPVTRFYRVHSSSHKKVNSRSLWCDGPHNGLYLDMAMEIPSLMLTFHVVIGFWTLPHVFFFFHTACDAQNHKSNSQENGMRWKVGFWGGCQRLGSTRRRSRWLQRDRSRWDPWRTCSSSYCCWANQERPCNRWTCL